MQIKPAPNQNQSQVLKSAQKSNLITVALFALGVAAAIAWHFTPSEHKSAILTVGGIGLGGGLTAIRFYNAAIRDGRIDIGDLDPEIATRVLLRSSESDRLTQVRDFIEGRAKLEQLPQVRDAIAAQIAEARPSMHEKIRALAQRQRPDFSHLQPYEVTEGVALPPIEMGAQRTMALSDLAAIAQEQN